MERNSVKKPLVLSVANYTENPGPRYIRQGDSSGEDFYLSILNKAFVECIQKDLMLLVDLDGTSGYPSSFLDEAFGELVYDFSLEEVKKRVRFTTTMFKKRKEQVENETYEQWEKKRKTNSPIDRTAKPDTVYYAINDRHELEERKI